MSPMTKIGNFIAILCILLRLSNVRRLAGTQLGGNPKPQLYVFVTGPGRSNILGVAYVGTVCARSDQSRVSINRYGRSGSQKNAMLYTAEVITYYRI